MASRAWRNMDVHADSVMGLDMAGRAWYYTKHQRTGPHIPQVQGWLPNPVVCGEHLSKAASTVVSRWRAIEKPPRLTAAGGFSRVFR